MARFLVRRLLVAIPTLIAISFIIFAVLDLAPGDPTGNLPLTIPAEVREQVRRSLGVDDPFLIKYAKWARQFFVYEPISLFENATGITFPGQEGRLRILSWQTRSPVSDLIVQRLPQTLWVVGLAYLLGIVIAIPVGVYSAYRQYSIFDQVGTLVSMIGFSVPTFFTGLLAIIVFSVHLKWFPSIYDTTLVVRDWPSFVQQLRQMIMPVTVLAFFNASQLSRFMRSTMLDNIHQDYARTARSKGLKERVVILQHVLRNSLIPVVTLIALGIPGVFTGAIITEQIFRVNGLGDLLIRGIYNSDIPLVQTITFMFAVLIVFFNILADVAYGYLDPRIRYV
ncbi:ABC transporter permease [soil metagenome]|nr:ABC transporter permease [Trueperaceae bacterium]